MHVHGSVLGSATRSPVDDGRQPCGADGVERPGPSRSTPGASKAVTCSTAFTPRPSHRGQVEGPAAASPEPAVRGGGCSYVSSATGIARKPLPRGNPDGARQTMDPLDTDAVPTLFLTNARFVVSETAGNSVHLASSSCSRPAFSTTKSTSRVRSRQKNRLPARPAPAPGGGVGRTRTSPTRPRRPVLAKGVFGADVEQRTEQTGVGQVQLGALDDRLRAVREPRFQQDDLAGCLEHRQPLLAVDGAMPTSRARSALLSRLADRRAQARRKRSKSRRLPTLPSERTSRSR